MSCLGPFVASLPPRWLRFNFRPVPVVLMLEKYQRDRTFSEHFRFLLPVSFNLCPVIIYSYTTDIIWYHKLTPSLKNALKMTWVEYTEACCRRRHSALRKIGCISSMGLNSFLLLCLMLWQHNSGHVRCWCDVHASYTCVYWSINT